MFHHDPLLNLADTAFTAAPPALPSRQEPKLPAWRPSPAVLGGGGAALAVLLLWLIAAHTGWVPPAFLPGPDRVLARLWQLATQGFMDATLWQHLLASLGRIAAAFALAVLTAVPLGLWAGLNPWVRAVADPLVESYRPVPPLAYLPLIVIWFGIGELSKVLLIYLAIFAPLFIATASAVQDTPPSRLLAARSFGASGWQRLWWVVLPGALPRLLTGARIALGAGWSTLVAAELIAATRGLGFMVQSAAQFLVTDVVIAGIVVIAAVAFTLEGLLRLAERRFTGWHRHG